MQYIIIDSSMEDGREIINEVFDTMDEVLKHITTLDNSYTYFEIYEIKKLSTIRL